MGSPRPASSCAHYFAERVGNVRPFPPRLRRGAIYAVKGIWRGELTAWGLDLVHLLNRLDASEGDLIDSDEWYTPLAQVMRSPVGANLISGYLYLPEWLVSF